MSITFKSSYKFPLFFYTAPEDYTSLSQDHTFTPGGSTRRCSTIQISPDDAVESSETFSAGLQSMVDILGTPSNAFILVLDSSSKQHYTLHLVPIERIYFSFVVSVISFCWAYYAQCCYFERIIMHLDTCTSMIMFGSHNYRQIFDHGFGRTLMDREVEQPFC